MNNMALIECKECGRQISSLAKACPNCGCPLSSEVKVDELETALNPTPEKEELGAETQETIPTDSSSSILKKGFKLNKKAIIFIVAAAVVVLIVVIGSILFFSVNSQEKEMISSVVTLIDSIGTVTVDSEKSIEKAEDAYAELSFKEKIHVSNRKALNSARTTYDNLVVGNTIAAIDSIGDVDLQKYSLICEARQEYDSLNENQKNAVKNINTLLSAEEAYQSLAVEECIRLIDSIGTVTISSLETIEEAEEMYNSIDEQHKASVTNYSDLESARRQIIVISEEHCIDLIDKIGEVDLSKESLINEARSFYDGLDSSSQANIKNIKKLEDAENKIVRLKEKAALKAKQITPGSVVQNDNWKVTFKKAHLTSRIDPNQPDSFFMYYTAGEDRVFLDLVFEVKNISSDSSKLQNAFGQANVTYDDQYNYSSYQLIDSTGDDVDKVYSWDGLSALDTATLHVAFQIPKEVQSNNKPIDVVLNIAGQEKYIKVR